MSSELSPVRWSSAEPIGFWTNIPFPKDTKTSKAEQFLVNCFNFGSRTIRLIPTRVEGLNSCMMVEERSKTSGLGIIKTVIKIASCLLLGVFILPVKYALRKKYDCVVFNPSNLKNIHSEKQRFTDAEFARFPFSSYANPPFSLSSELGQIDMLEYRNLFFKYSRVYSQNNASGWEIEKREIDFDSRLVSVKESQFSFDEFEYLAIDGAESRLPRFKDSLFLHKDWYGGKAVVRIDLPLGKPTSISANILSAMMAELKNNPYTNRFDYKAEPISGDSENAMVTRTIRNNNHP